MHTLHVPHTHVRAYTTQLLTLRPYLRSLSAQRKRTSEIVKLCDSVLSTLPPLTHVTLKQASI